MGTKTIGVRDEVYERLVSERQPDESFSDAIDRLLDEVDSDWRRSFGKYDDERGDRLSAVVEEQREHAGESLAERQDEVLR